MLKVTLKRPVYLAGPVEIQDTWRERASEALQELGFDPINPMRSEKLKPIGKHIQTSTPDSLIVLRDLSDLQRCKLSAGLVLMNLSTTKEGRKPIGTLFELMWSWDNQLPVIAIINNKTCASAYKNHPWIREMVSHSVPSVTAALSLIEEYFA